MAYCSKCGKEAEGGDTFCHACGAAIVAGGATGGTAQPQATSALSPPPYYAAAPVPPVGAAAYPGQEWEGSPQEIAERRVKQKMELWWHFGSYVIVNIFLVIVWALTGRGYPWFVWVMVGWGIGVAFHIMQYFMTIKGEPSRQRMIQREMEKLQREQGAPAAPPPQETGQEQE
jgi:hypothetical protein